MAKKLYLKFRDIGFASKEFAFNYPKDNLQLATIRSVAESMISGGVKSGSTGVALGTFDSAYYEETIKTDIVS